MIVLKSQEGTLIVKAIEVFIDNETSIRCCSNAPSMSREKLSWPVGEYDTPEEALYVMQLIEDRISSGDTRVFQMPPVPTKAKVMTKKSKKLVDVSSVSPLPD